MAKTRTNIDDHEVVIDMVYIEERSGTPRYQQLYEQLRALIRNARRGSRKEISAILLIILSPNLLSHI